MDNKKDKQFYWEVKNFLSRNTKTNVPAEKKSSLKDISKNILEQNNLFKQPNNLSKPETINAAKEILGSLEKERRGYDVSCVAFTRNNISNPFNKNLIEYVQSPEAVARQKAQAEARNERARERNAQEQARRDAAKADIKRRREEDEAYQYNKEQEAKGQGPMPDGGNVSDGLEMGRDGNPNLPADTPENRAKLTALRREKADTQQAAYMAKRMEELSAKDPSTLTSSEAGELSLFKGMLSGPNASKGLETRVKENISKSAEAEASAAQGPMPDGGNRATEPSTKVANVFASTVGRSQDELVSQTQTAQAKEIEQKEKETADFYAQRDALRAQQKLGQRIQGTSMTYGQFKELTGRDYNALSNEDSSLAIRYASSSSAGRFTPLARETALTADQMNRGYAQQNAELAQREGKLDRAVDLSQMELDRFRNDPNYRKQVVQGEISTTQAQPGFVRNVAQTMTSPQSQPARIGQPTTTPQGGAAPAPQPARIGAPSVTQAINSVLGDRNRRRA